MTSTIDSIFDSDLSDLSDAEEDVIEQENDDDEFHEEEVEEGGEKWFDEVEVEDDNVPLHFQRGHPTVRGCLQGRFDFTPSCEFQLTPQGREVLTLTDEGQDLLNQAEVQRSKHQGDLARWLKCPNLIKCLLKHAEPELPFPIAARDGKVLLRFLLTVGKSRRQMRKVSDDLTVDDATLHKSNFRQALFDYFDQVY
ncbi:hypothetical protein CBS101457_006051 [Exobasidium rhododendri]|nr:hypothetical protein CBS101457_006051 [Exobasidium rhododendri]